MDCLGLNNRDPKKGLPDGLLDFETTFSAISVGLVLMQFGLPGVMHVIDETPSMKSIFDFPMALAPTLVVPIFVTLNLLVAVRLLTRQ